MKRLHLRASARVLISAALLGGLLTATGVSPGTPVAADPPAPIDGVADGCDDFQLYLGLFSVDIPDPGWTWVNPSQVFRSATGVALKSEVTHTDFPVVHDSHDLNVDILLDPGQEGLLSIVNPDKALPVGPDTIEVEWEIGTHPDERSPGAPERYLPKWVWPNQGDRVWTNGHHIYDCGHTIEVDGIERARSEIHPPRALASMRDQMGTLNGTGSTPVRTTAVDLYVHGFAGFVTEILYCGQDIVIEEDLAFDCPTKSTPIDDTYEFDVPLPPKPFPTAVLGSAIEDGPANTLGIAPIIEPTPVDNPTSVHVTIPLDGTGAQPSDVYARRMRFGWIAPPEDLKLMRLTLNKMDLHEDQDVDPGDCECTFFWMNVDRAASEWIRLADFATGDMNDYDDDGGLGDGEMGFSGATFDFYGAADMPPVNVRAHGYDQDCLDDYFGDHVFGVGIFLDCYLAAAFELEAGDNDDFNVLSTSFSGPDWGAGPHDVSAGGQYELEFNIEQQPLTVEDSADLQVDKFCKPDSTALAGTDVTCYVVVRNPGPGLPRDVVVTDTLYTAVPPTDYTLESASFGFEGSTTSAPCEIALPNRFTCDLVTVPVGGAAIVTSVFSSEEPGDFNNEAVVTSSSTDPDLNDNRDIDATTVLPVSDLSISLDASPDPVTAGLDLTYEVELSNAGPSTAVNTVAALNLPAGLDIDSVTGSGGATCTAGTPGDALLPTTCTFDSVPALGTRTMTVVANVRPRTIGLIAADASVRSDSLDVNNIGNVDNEVTTVVAKADLELVKTASHEPAVAGTDLTYRLELTNTGPSLARQVHIVDSLPSSSRLKSWAVVRGGGSCAADTSTPQLVECLIDDLAPGQSAVVSLTTSIAASTQPGTITNSATASSVAAELDSADNSDHVDTTVTTSADLRLSIVSDKNLYKPSSTVDYTVTVADLGPSDSQNVVVTITLPPKRTGEYLFDNGGCVRSGTILTCPVGTVFSGSADTFHVYVRVAGSKGVVATSATATSTTFDPTTPNSKTASVLIQGKGTK